jgi:PAS domain S-box-containing protein
MSDKANYQERNELLQQENDLLRERIGKFNLLNNLFYEMLKLQDLKSIYQHIANSLHENIPDTIVLYNVINEQFNESRLEVVAGLNKGLFQKFLSLSGFNPIGKTYPLVPEHNDYCRTGKLVEFKEGLAQFSASELSPIVAHAIEKMIGLKKIHSIGIVKDEILLAAIHFFSFSSKNQIDSDFVELLVKQAGIILQKKIAENELKESEIRFKVLHNASFGGIAVHDKGLIVDCNQGMSTMTGYSLEELIGMDGLQLIAERDRPYVIQQIVSGSEKTYEATGLRKNGTEYPMRLEGRNVPYRGKQIRTVEFRDITEQKKNEVELINAKERAEESDRLKSAFLANMSHEIRTPMNGILGFASLLKNQKLTEEEQQEYYSIIEKSGERMLNIINDLINISKVESGQMEISFSATNLNDQMEFLHNFFRLEAKQKGINFSIVSKLPAKQAVIYTDIEKIYAILTNLIKNALKFTSKGSIEFGCQQKGEFYEFNVTDSGIGISREKQKAVFERFVQAESYLTRRFEGAGLGLAISKAYVEMLGGEIWLTSKVGEGSTFFFTLPVSKGLHPEPILAGNLDIKEDGKPGNETILIAEDDESSMFYLTKILKGITSKLILVKSGFEAVEACRNQDIDLILMDIQMPVMDGFTAAKLIKEMRPELPILAQTSFALDSDKAMYGGIFSDYLTKPLNADEVRKKVNFHLRKIRNQSRIDENRPNI